MITSAVCCSISLNPYYGISNLEIWNHEKKKKKKKKSNSIVSLYC